MTHRHETTANGHTAHAYGYPLGVVCRACKRRALVPLDRLGVESGDMRQLMSLRLVCTGCGGRGADFWIVPPNECDDWLAGKIG